MNLASLIQDSQLNARQFVDLIEGGRTAFQKGSRGRVADWIASTPGFTSLDDHILADWGRVSIRERAAFLMTTAAKVDTINVAQNEGFSCPFGRMAINVYNKAQFAKYCRWALQLGLVFKPSGNAIALEPAESDQKATIGLAEFLLSLTPGMMFCVSRDLLLTSYATFSISQSDWAKPMPVGAEFSFSVGHGANQVGVQIKLAAENRTANAVLLMGLIEKSNSAMNQTGELTGTPALMAAVEPGGRERVRKDLIASGQCQARLGRYELVAPISHRFVCEFRDFGNGISDVKLKLAWPLTDQELGFLKVESEKLISAAEVRNINPLLDFNNRVSVAAAGGETFVMLPRFLSSETQERLAALGFALRADGYGTRVSW